MWDYSEKVKEYFFNPKNAGPLDGANAVGEVGAIACGDALKLMLKIDPITEVITDARFQTFGCGSAIASSSAVTEMIIGRTVAEALKITNADIAAFLGGLPPEKMHCSVMGYEALQSAIAQFRGEEWRDDHAEGALICKCFGVDEGMIERAIRANKLTTLAQVTAYTKAGGGCQTCSDGVEQVLARVNRAMVEAGELPAHQAHRGGGPAAPFEFKVLKQKPRIETKIEAKVEPKIEAKPARISPEGIEPSPKQSPLAPVPGLATPGKMTNLQKIRAIEAAIADLRPYLQQDGGDCELVDVEGNVVHVKLAGACIGCQMASVTISGVQERLIQKLGIPLRVIPVK